MFLFPGKGDQIWKAAKQSGERIARHVQEFRQLQNRLSTAIDAIEKDEKKRLDQSVDEEVMATRDHRGNK